MAPVFQVSVKEIQVETTFSVSTHLFLDLSDLFQYSLDLLNLYLKGFLEIWLIPDGAVFVCLLGEFVFVSNQKVRQNSANSLCCGE